MEVWRKIPGFTRFSASSYGRIRRDEAYSGIQPSLLKQSKNVGGYFVVNVVHDWGFSCGKAGVHRLVALAFLGPPTQEARFVLHGNGNREDNRPENLRYGTIRENVRDAVLHGTAVMGEAHPCAKLNRSQVVQIVADLAAGLSQATIGKKHGVKQSTIHLIASGKKWKSVTGGPVKRNPLGCFSKINTDQAADIKGRMERGENADALAAEYQVCVSTIYKSVRRLRDGAERRAA